MSTIKTGATLVAGAFAIGGFECVILGRSETELMLILQRISIQADPAKFSKVQIIKTPKEEANAG